MPGYKTYVLAQVDGLDSEQEAGRVCEALGILLGAATNVPGFVGVTTVTGAVMNPSDEVVESHQFVP